jgi:hypothetical protein
MKLGASLRGWYCHVHGVSVEADIDSIGLEGKEVDIDFKIVVAIRFTVLVS